MQDSDSSSSKVVRLFTYLEKVLSTSDDIVRDFRSTTAEPSPWWLSALPKNQENLYVFSNDDNSDSDKDGSTVIRVKKQKIQESPALPKELEEWVDDINPATPPSANEYVERKIYFEDSPQRVEKFREFENDYYHDKPIPSEISGWVDINHKDEPVKIAFIFQKDNFSEHPQLRELLEGYAVNEWKPWAEKTIESYKVNVLYDQLYALRQLLKTEGDTYELLLGRGILTWRHPEVGTVFGPIFNSPLVLDFDAINRTIEISIDPTLKSYVDISILHEITSKSEFEIVTWADRINGDPFDFANYEAIRTQGLYLVNNLSTESEDTFSPEMTAEPITSDKPSMWNAPVIFVRKRSSDLWSKYAGTIRRDIEQNDVGVNEFINDLVGNYSEAEEVSTNDIVESIAPSGALDDGELFFPLPWNDEQKRIAERLDANYGVVVKGPPGTGKSHTIANLISRFLSQGKTVLVTSQTSKALEVLRDKLPENIQSLAVSQLHQTAKQDQVLQESIAEISSNLGERHTKFSDAKVELVRRELADVRKNKALISNKIRKHILSDTQNTTVIDGETIKPMDAARIVAESTQSGTANWLTDDIPFDADLPFNEQHLNELHDLSQGLKPADFELNSLFMPPIETLPSSETVRNLFETKAELVSKLNDAAAIVQDAHSVSIDADEAVKMLEQLNDVRSSLNSFTTEYEKELFIRCESSDTEREYWFNVLKKIFEATKEVRDLEARLIGINITGTLEIEIETAYEAIAAMRKKTPSGAKLGGMSKMLLPSSAKQIMGSLRINSSIPDTHEELDILEQWYRIAELKTIISSSLDLALSKLQSSNEMNFDPSDIVSVEILLKELSRVVLFRKKHADLQASLSSHRQLSAYNLSQKKDVEALIEFLSSFVAKFELADIDKSILDIEKNLREQALNPACHPIVGELANAIHVLDVESWKIHSKHYHDLFEIKQRVSRFYEIEQLIRPLCPELLAKVVEVGFKVPNNLVSVWRIARIKNWLNSINDGEDIAALQRDHERLSKRELSLNSELVTIMSWQRQIDRVTRSQRDALMMWSLAMKKYGKGTGKYAATHLRSAQQALAQAQAAVPVWIMPLHRVVQMFPNPKAGLFDVVIFDEASQCDIKGITVGYLGKKLLVVGDPEQISPAGVFQNQEKIFELISRYLHDIPHKESFSITSSLFDLAKIRLSNIVQLNEHFRCVPEIIGFSNHHIYENKLKPLRYPQPAGKLSPALVPILVNDGYQNKNNKVNEPEAHRLVNKLVELLEDPNYETRPNGNPCTFGVISLLGDDQVKYIKSLISEKIDEKTIEERQILCGNAYTFQGDERDVILMTMVKALDQDKPSDTVRALNTEIAKQSFNVAASRARDQAFLFHSIPIEEYRNSEDWRYKLLNWFYNPKTEELNAGRAVLKKEFESGRASQFSVDVGNLIINRGYQVIPEYPVIGYRIDLVVQGENARLAIECDGDQYHTLENWEQDQFREQQLRRAGWEFWRITGSSFYLNGESALSSLWQKLDEMGIEPLKSRD